MTCLFGDSTDSELELDYLYLVRDIIGYAVEVFVATERIHEVREAARAAEDSAAGERRKIEDVRKRLTSALADSGDGEGSARCTEAILSAGDKAVEAELRRIDDSLARERSLADRSAATQRRVCERALEKLLLVPHTLPGAEDQLELTRAGDIGYAATLRARAPYGLETELDLDIPEGNLFGAVVQALQVVPAFELHVPEARGWLSKKIKTVRHKLGKHIVTRVRISSGRVTISLRHPTMPGTGYDLMHDALWPAPRIVPLGDDGAADLAAAHEIDSQDEDQVTTLLTTLVGAAETIKAEPTALASAKLDNVPLSEHDDPTELVDRLIGHIAPTVKAIVEHSLGSDELVLKKQIGSDRREELYVSKTELLGKLDALQPQQRARLAPLGLFEASPPAPPQQPRRRHARGTGSSQAQRETKPQPSVIVADEAPAKAPAKMPAEAPAKVPAKRLPEPKRALEHPVRRSARPIARIPKRAESEA